MKNNKAFYFTKLTRRLCALAAFLALLATNQVVANATQYQIAHLEPMSWWTNMYSNKLQLMVHGKNISELTPSVNEEDIKIVNVSRGDSANYLFIDLHLSNNLTAGNYTIHFKKAGKAVLTVSYPIAERNEISAAVSSYSAKDVIYLITPDRFANGDSNNDQVAALIEKPNRSFKGGRHGGDIQGIINHLPYIAEMGFTQIWSNPLVENNQAEYSYHGYSATDFYQIDSRYGSNQLYRELSTKAQDYSIGLIKDVVLNHIGSNHWWLKDLPTKDWLNYQGKAFVGTNHKRQTLHDPHGVTSDKSTFSDGWFVPTMPDLNQRNPQLATYLIQNTLWWIEYANLSGLRVDTYSYSDKAFLSQWSKAITDEYPNINIVGEEWSTNPAIVAYWQEGKTSHDNYQSYMPSMVDFPLQDALIRALTAKENWNTGLNQLYQVLANDFQYADPYNLVTFADNHDVSRLFSTLNADVDLAKIALGFILTTRGIPQIYYGSEIFMTNGDNDDHGLIRGDFPGGWPQDQANAFLAKGLTAQQREAQQYLKKLLNWRKESAAISEGKLTHYAPENGVYVYFRTLAASPDKAAEKVMVVINKNHQTVTLNPAKYAEVIQTDTRAENILNDEKITLTDVIKLKGKSINIWQLSN